MDNMLHNFNYVLEDLESDLQYEFDDNDEDNFEDDERTQLGT
jgi:hypothetical protein